LVALYLAQLAQQVEHKLAVHLLQQVEHEAVDHQVLKLQQQVAQFQVDVLQLRVVAHQVLAVVAVAAQVAVRLIIQHLRIA
jgi:hypothetical protein